VAIITKQGGALTPLFLFVLFVVVVGVQCPSFFCCCCYLKKIVKPFKRKKEHTKKGGFLQRIDKK